ncbi:uncharacterized protein [Miscanthus floridulus]|uniref:uncharacterized protein n=1 Tax=Miscanthus floridulus TaxID=154761 RepID=UPI003458B56C
MGRLTPAVVMALPVVLAAVSGLPAINVTTMAFEDAYAPLFATATCQHPPLRRPRTDDCVHRRRVREAAQQAGLRVPGQHSGASHGGCMQINVYGNSGVDRGQEERYVLPFDPTREFLRYFILWTAAAVSFYVEDASEVRWSDDMGGDFLSKPMTWGLGERGALGCEWV